MNGNLQPDGELCLNHLTQMEENRQYLLQFTDSLTDRKCVLRIGEDEAFLPLNDLLGQYLKNPPLEHLLESGRITTDSAETLSSLQDLVYICSDAGHLGDIFGGVIFRQGQRSIDLRSAARLEQTLVKGTPVFVINLHIDRVNAGYDRNWVGFQKRRWTRHHKMYSDFVESTLEREGGHAEAQAILQLSSRDQKLRLVQILAKKVWVSDFENYSRFTGRKLAHKTGDETVCNIIEGAGGVCSEKVQALKFITDHYEITSEYLLAGVDAPGPIPESKLRELLQTFDFRFSKRYMRYWQHTALLYDIEGTSVLVDVTNGNIPLLFLTDGAADRILRQEDKQPVSVKMIDRYEDFYYHRVAQDIPENFFFAMEGWIEYMDLVQVFENELGLYLSENYFVTPIVYKNSKERSRLKQEYAEVCNDAGLAYSVSDGWNLDSPLGEQFTRRAPRASEEVLLSEEHLLKRYNEWDGRGHAGGLLIMQLHK